MKTTLTGLALLSLASVAQAELITIENFSFFDPLILTNDQNPTNDPNTEDYTVSAPPAWSVVPTGNGDAFGVANPTNSEYPGTGGNGADGNLPGTANGVTFGYLNLGGITTSSMTYAGTSLGTFSDFGPGAAYTLTLAIGKRSAGENPIYRLELLDGGSPVAFNEGTAPLKDFSDLTATFFATTQTGAIGIRIIASTATNGFSQANFDNVRLDVIPVPEPGTLGFLGLSAAGIAGLRRRRS